MPTDRLEALLGTELARLEESGARKGAEPVIVEVLPAAGERGPRVRLAGEGSRLFLRMNSNGYLGLARRSDTIAAEEAAARAFGTGPEAVRFISGSFAPHVELERRLAAFHGREACMLFSSAYAAVMGVLPLLVTPQTAVISDELNHNCIIQALRLAGPAQKHVYPHGDLAALEAALSAAAGACRRALVVTDGVFSMRGDHAPLGRIVELARAFDRRLPENVLVVVDDSHGVGALGSSGRGTEEVTGARADLLVATLGKALGVNGGYVVGPCVAIEFLRERSPFYVYSNPITPGEAAAALAALDVLEGPEGRVLLARLRALAARLRAGLVAQGWETLPGEHPVVPLLVRDGARTRALVRFLRERGILVTGLSHPVVPRGEEELRFQVSAAHGEDDVDEVLAALAEFPERPRGGGELSRPAASGAA